MLGCRTVMVRCVYAPLSLLVAERVLMPTAVETFFLPVAYKSTFYFSVFLVPLGRLIKVGKHVAHW